MYDSKLMQVVRKLQTRELTKLVHMSETPLYNRKEEVIKLARYLRSQCSRFTKENLSIEAIHKAVFGAGPVNTKRLSYVTSALADLINELALSEQLQTETVHRQTTLMRWYDQLGLEKQYQSVRREARQHQDANPYRDSAYYFDELQIHESENAHFEQLKKRSFDAHLQQAVDSLDRFYLARKLKYCCEMLNRNRAVSADYELHLVDELLGYLDNHPHDDVAAISIYRTILLMLRDEQSDQFKKLKLQLDDLATQFPPKEAKDMYDYALNYCILRINQGESNYLREAFDLYLQLLQKELIFENNRISPWTFKNIVVISLRLNEFSWVDQFITDMEPRLSDDFRANAVAFNRAYVDFHRGRYQEALERLTKVEFTDVYYSLDTKSLLVKTFYELDEYDLLYSQLDSFKVYLRRNKLISDDMRRVYSNYLRFVHSLMGLNARDHARATRLKEQLETTKQMADKTWLRAKLAERLGETVKGAAQA